MAVYSRWEVFRYLYLKLMDEDGSEIIHSLKVNNWIKETIDKLCKTKKLIKEIPQVGFLCAILPFYDENIFGGNALTLIESMLKMQPGVSSYLWHALLNEKCKIENWDKKSFTRIIKSLIDNDESYNRDIYDYQLDKVLDKYRNSIIKKYPEEFADIFCEWCLKKEKKSPLKFGGISTVAVDEKFDFLEKSEASIIKMLKIIIEESKEAARYILNDNRYSVSRVISKLQVFAISKHYSSLKDKLFLNKDNPFDQKNLIGDLYYLVETCKLQFNEKEINILYYWILNSDFGYRGYENFNIDKEYKNTNINICRYYFLKSLNEVTGSFNDDLVKFNADDYRKYSNMYDRSWAFKNLDASWEDGKEVTKQIKDKSIAELIDFYSDESVSADEKYKRRIAIGNYIENNKYGLEEIRTMVNQIPVYYHSELFSYSINRSFFERPMECFNIVKNDLLNNFDLISSEGNIRDYFFFFEKVFIQNFRDKEASLEIAKFVLAFMLEKENTFVKEYDYDKNDDQSIITGVLNNWYCTGIKIVLGTIYFSKDDKLRISFKALVSNWYEKDDLEKKTLVYYALCFYSNYLIGIDAEWAEIVLRNILDDNTIDITIESAKWSELLYNLILEKYNRGELTLNKSWAKKLLQWSVYYYVYYNQRIDNIVSIIVNEYGIDSFSSAIFQILSMADDKQKRLEIAEILIELCRMFNAESVIINKETDILINNFTEALFKLDIEDDVAMQSLNKLSGGFSSYISDTTVNYLIYSFPKHKEAIASIVEKMIKNSSTWAFAYEMDFDKLIVMIGEDPETRKVFYRINNELTDRNIYRFKDVIND